MKNIYYLLIVSLFALVMASGCATVTRGTTDGLVIESKPSGAKVNINRIDQGFTKKELKKNQHIESVRAINDGELDENREYQGEITTETPAVVNLARKGHYEVRLSKTGYETQTVAVTGSVSGKGSAGMAGNVILGGLVGAGVDASTGAMKDLKPNPVVVDFTSDVDEESAETSLDTQ